MMAPFVDSENDRLTDEAMKNPQVGDRFSEMYNFWVYVIDVDGDIVATMEAFPPATLPRDGIVKTQTKEDFIKRFAYDNIPGYWVQLIDRGNDVEGWYQKTHIVFPIYGL